jgi:hypothetical protein
LRKGEAIVLNPTTLLADGLGEYLAATFRRTFGDGEPRIAALIGEAARLVVERIATGDALYHGAEHSVLVTLVGQDILRGVRLKRAVTPEDWLHFTLATLCHDIGYLRGVCRGDQPDRYVTDAAGGTMTPPRGASDAFLAPYHIERSKIVVRERFAGHPLVDPERVARAIELTRFPVPDDGDHAETDTEAGLVRGADLIGQLGDPLYPRKLNALFHEFAEIGVNARLGYETAADVADKYPAFFWSRVEPYIGDAIGYLELTMEGRQWVANLYSHVFAIEHERRRIGPHRGGNRAPPDDDRRRPVMAR